MKRESYFGMLLILAVATALALASLAIATSAVEITTHIKDQSVHTWMTPISKGVVYDNGMSYEGLASSQRDEVYPFESVIADDFTFEVEYRVNHVQWIGGYWAGPPDDGNFDWEIVFYHDFGDGTKPGAVIATYTLSNADVHETLISGSPGEENWFFYFAILPGPVLSFDPFTKYWISIQGIGIYPPQSGWAYHTDQILLHEAVFKSVYFGYPDWTNSSTAFGASCDVAFQIIGEAEPDTVLRADFNAYPRSVLIGNTVQFIDLSTGYPSTWHWDFGDDSFDTDQHPTHAYNDAGYFDVKLVVSDGTDADSNVKYNYIQVFTLGHIAGFVRDTLGQPISQAEVKVYETGFTTSTNPDGYYRFTNLDPGNYIMSVEASGYEMGETTAVPVAGPDTTWVDFTLRAEFFSVDAYITPASFNFGITTGDFNGDNNVDIVVLSPNGSQWGITRMWGSGDGTFTLQPLIQLGGAVIVNGHFNSDDFLDFAVDDVDQLAIMLNDGAGNFTPRYFDLHGSSPLSITKGYLDSDANLDVITANMSTENLSIFRGIGNGDMVFVKNLDIYCHSVDVGDFNKDGNADLAVGTDSLIVLLGDGNWNFTRSFGAYFGAAFSVSTMNSLADFNHDGNLDVIFCVPNYAGMGSAQIVILLGNGLGGFSSITAIYAPHAVIQSVAAGDFNGDNNLDIAANYAGWWVALKVYFGDGAGGFPHSVLTDINNASISCVTGDFNKDGNADIVAGTVDDSVLIFLNLHPPKPAIEDEFVITGYTSVNLSVTDKYGVSANILANAMAGADYYQKDCDSDSALDDRLYHFNAVPGRYEVGVTLRPGAEPGTEGPLGIRIDGGMEVFIPTTAKGPESLRGDTTFFTITDSLPTLCLPVDDVCLCVDSLTLFWNQIEGTTQYHLQLDDSSDFGSPEVDDSAVTDTSLSLISSLLGRKYHWRVRANGGVWSVFSETGSFFPYLCGDVNGDCLVELGDAVYLLNYLFKGGPEADCALSADVNSSGVTELGDAVYVLNYLFRGGPAPGC